MQDYKIIIISGTNCITSLASLKWLDTVTSPKTDRKTTARLQAKDQVKSMGCELKDIVLT